MIRTLSTACAAAALGTALAVPAHADGEVRVEPSRAEPGETVTITAPTSCNDPVATSNAFPYGVQVQLSSADDPTSGRPLGQTEIDSAATPTAYSVDVKCSDGSTITGSVEVVPIGTGPGPDTGGGGLAALNGPRDWGAALAAGAGLVLAAGIGAAVRRSRRDRTEFDA
ncbi:hypothetical protein [Spirillospora sp. NPDC047279]|uniref:hypothetical protein n=1 Tax=Spirillospora sp. NPDC047279 TaxID=3155478 RepID=UPI0033DEC6ED